MSKRAIPALPPTAIAQGRAAFDSALKENVERITGARGGKIELLLVDASTSDIIAKLNEVIERLQ